MGNMPSKVLLFCALGALLPLASRAENPREIGTVVTTQGVVSIVDAAGATREAGRRSPVHEGETVVVAPDGFASFRMVDNAHLSLGPATELVFSTYRHDGKSGTKDSVVLNLKLGCFRARAGAAGSGRRDDYRVDTPFASIDVEASFHGASLVGNSLYTATWQGATVVRNALGSLSLGKYGDYEFSRTFAGEAPRGLAALLPAAACDAPKSLDGELQETGRYRIDRDGEDAR